MIIVLNWRKYKHWLFFICILYLFPSAKLQAQKILVAFYSETGHTEVMANEIVAGVKSISGSEVRLLKIDDVKIDDLLWSEGIILGSPVHSANMAAPMMEFFRNWPFEGQKMKDKIGAAFVTAGGISAGEETAQLAILRSMLVFNMIIVGGPDWTSPFGASGIMGEGEYELPGNASELNSLFLKKGYALGKRVAELTLNLNKTPCND